MNLATLIPQTRTEHLWGALGIMLDGRIAYIMATWPLTLENTVQSSSVLEVE